MLALPKFLGLLARRGLSRPAVDLTAMTTAFAPRAVCARCGRPARVCYCAHVTSLPTRTRVLILQHPRERDVAIGTARIASLCLPNAELLVGVEWEQSAALARAFSDPARPAVLLYPGEGARDVVRDAPHGPVTLVVIDGTWSQARKIVRTSPLLAALPRYAFTPSAPSEYRIRKEPSASCVSTIEALAYALGALEGDATRFHALLAPFRAMVDAQIACQGAAGHARARKPRAKRKALAVPACLRERRGNLVCVVGEANAWPYGSPERGETYPDEIVQWAAYRVASGERFDFVVAPSHPLAPSTTAYVALDEACLRAGGTRADLAARWRAFVRDDDIVCSWGRYATSLFAGAGGYLPRQRVDLRHVARALLNDKVGTLDDFLVRAGVPEARRLARGRAGLRLGQAVEAIEWLAQVDETSERHCERAPRGPWPTA